MQSNNNNNGLRFQFPDVGNPIVGNLEFTQASVLSSSAESVAAIPNRQEMHFDESSNASKETRETSTSSTIDYSKYGETDGETDGGYDDDVFEPSPSAHAAAAARDEAEPRGRKNPSPPGPTSILTLLNHAENWTLTDLERAYLKKMYEFHQRRTNEESESVSQYRDLSRDAEKALYLKDLKERLYFYELRDVFPDWQSFNILCHRVSTLEKRLIMQTEDGRPGHDCSDIDPFRCPLDPKTERTVFIPPPS